MKKINFLFLILLSLILFFLEIVNLDRLEIFFLEIKFSYTLVLTILVSLNCRNIYQVLIFCLVNGLLIDIFNNFTSFYFINLIIMSLIVNNFSKKVTFSNLYLFIIISFSTFFVEIINATLIGFFYYGFENNLVSYQIFKENILKYVIGNNIIGYFFNLFIKKIFIKQA
ncbi:MAG: hypothetical protein KatS3mg068_0912 [Candidatus Sericytochromatia bacterium]|nr:MAG: hypothetical protein KatS3mg068_0912 [Candidatus Sericytochromatia bacterium]